MLSRLCEETKTSQPFYLEMKIDRKYRNSFQDKLAKEEAPDPSKMPVSCVRHCLTIKRKLFRRKSRVVKTGRSTKNVYIDEKIKEEYAKLRCQCIILFSVSHQSFSGAVFIIYVFFHSPWMLLNRRDICGRSNVLMRVN